MAHIKWPSGKIVCQKCGGDSVSPIRNRPKLQCNSRACKAQFSLTTGTLFEDSHVPLSAWFPMIWAAANSVRISSRQFGELIGVSQQTAWRMTRTIHLAMEAI